MKFIIEKNVLLDALINVSRAISTRTTIPILNGIKFDLKNEGLYLTSYFPSFNEISNSIILSLS